MTENQLAIILREMYFGAKRGEQVAQIHLFGIKYAEVINRENFKPGNIIKLSGLNLSYSTEVSKGMKLSKYVSIK